ncbi:MAG: DUF2497 domain-containing protein [Proteobacteria bacterium]|nr:DUF2497 domain-containing protein [Pseudomonadota bacterium]
MVDTSQLPEKSESVSMEEILNSIRQAIGETNETPNNTSLNQSEFVPVGSSDVLELTHPIETPVSSPSIESPAASFSVSTPLTPPSSSASNAPSPSVNAPTYTPISMSGNNPGAPLSPSPQGSSSPILSDSSYESVAHAFKVLSKAVEIKQAQEEHAGLSGQTVDVLMKEIMRPFIRDWLNQNLPMIVERLVAKEIERLTQSTLS